MFYSRELLTEQAKAYTARLGIAIDNQLGRGLQGIVFLASNQSAITVLLPMSWPIHRSSGPAVRGPRGRGFDDDEIVGDGF